MASEQLGTIQSPLKNKRREAPGCARLASHRTPEAATAAPLAAVAAPARQWCEPDYTQLPVERALPIFVHSNLQSCTGDTQ